MRYTLNDDYNPDNQKEKETSEWIQSLKSVEDLPEELKRAVRVNAHHMSKSFENQSMKIMEDQGLGEDDEVNLGALLTPFVMELSFLKIQLATLISQVGSLKDGDSD